MLNDVTATGRRVVTLMLVIHCLLMLYCQLWESLSENATAPARSTH